MQKFNAIVKQYISHMSWYRIFPSKSFLPFSLEPSEEDEESVEVDDVIGWEIVLSKAAADSRHYVIEAAILDAATDEHPVPCGCMAARCAFIQALNSQVSSVAHT